MFFKIGFKSRTESFNDPKILTDLTLDAKLTFFSKWPKAKFMIVIFREKEPLRCV